MTVKALEQKATQLREMILEMISHAGSGHTAGSLGMADIFALLYFDVLKIDPKKPNWPERDRFILSCGHICPILYATLALRGFFSKSELKTLRQFGSRLQGHPHRSSLPGIETTSGLLGQGLGQAAGMALVAKREKYSWRTYVILSDGEHDEGGTWEAVMFASKYHLDNLTVIIDRNNIQIDGRTESVMPLLSLEEKYRSFGWHVLSANGNSIIDMQAAIRHTRAVFDKPTAIVANTTPGKGVDFMEDDYRWHGRAPSKEELSRALKEIDRRRI